MIEEVATPNWTSTPTQGLQVNSTAISDDGRQLLFGTSAEYDTSDSFAIYSYSTDGSTYNVQWSDPLGSNVTQGVFWSAISGDGTQGAAGGEYGSGKGFLRTYNIAQGLSSKQEFDSTSRVNEVEIDQDGSYIVSVEGSNIHFYTLSSGAYSEATTNMPSSYLRSCGISDDGSWIVVGGEVSSYDEGQNYKRQDKAEDSSSGGLFYIFKNNSGQISQYGAFQSSAGILRVVISRDGQYAAASTKSGEVFCFNVAASSGSITPLWSYTPTDYNISLSYALAISHTSSGDLYVGVGGNHSSSGEDDEDTPAYGYSYMLQSTYDSGTGEYYGNRLWIYQLQYCPNPGMNMDAEAQLVTSADGQPIFSESEASDTSETPGNFYLFNAKSGYLYWQYPTSLMNWAMAINSKGTAVFAGSDNGTVYYWGGPS